MRKRLWRCYIPRDGFVCCFLGIMGILWASVACALVFNNPYPTRDARANIYYASFNEQPKTLDPARAYSVNEYQFIAQIYEPILQYDFFKRPYQLICGLCAQMPSVTYLNAHKEPVRPGEPVAFTQYMIVLKKGVYYQPHPAFAKNARGMYRYLHLAPDYLEQHNIRKLSDFTASGTREMIADDIIYQLKRIASPLLSSPIDGLMHQYIVGFDAYSKKIPTNIAKGQIIHLNQYDIEGVEKINDHQLRITIQGQYPQFIYWLAMPFFAPVPWEADHFYRQAGMDDHNISLDWYPVGTGPFMLTENNPNSRMVLEKNPYYRTRYLVTAEGRKKLPMIERAEYILEKESIPRWHKFLQGYYDLSSVGSDSFDQAIQVNQSGEPMLTPMMRQKKLRLQQDTEPAIYYLGFNMDDPVVGGLSQQHRLLRQAISLAVNYDEYISIFLNGRGLPAQSPIPPGIFGYRSGQEGINSVVYKIQDARVVRRDVSEARALMRRAGYPGGIDPETKEPLILHYDAIATGGPDDKSGFDWMRKQFAKIGIALDIRATRYNQFQEKMRNGNAQIFAWGWNADYPDPENFLFLLYGPNGKKRYGGENAGNYHNPVFDQLFEKMRNMPDSDARQDVIDRMLWIVREDAPWVFGFHAETLLLSQAWVGRMKPNAFNTGFLQYLMIDPQMRAQSRTRWNQVVLWPFMVLGMVFLIILTLLVISYRNKQKKSVPRVSS